MFPCKKIYFFLFFLLCSVAVQAQDDTALKSEVVQTGFAKKDSTGITNVRKANVAARAMPIIKDSGNAAVDSLEVAKKLADSLHIQDSIKKIQAKKLLPPKDTSTYAGFFGGLYIPVFQKAVAMLEKERTPQGKDELFYILVGLVALVAFTKALFPKYFANMFSLFFLTSYRQKQAVEQITSNKISSILLNTVFVLCGAIYISLIFDTKGLLHKNFWMVMLYTVGVLATVYIFKYLFLSFIGWVFNASEAVSTYTFVVFLSNKMVAIIFLPFVFVLAFTGSPIADAALVITYFLLLLVLLYRYFVALGVLRSNLNVNALHFFLYLCTIEILPLLLIYKAVFKLIARSI
ncbi:DUF4271 domain-containing protein [Parasediminibacterium sp. JCM 36343]|uniref:DUF4271 domain-containing protein n=1 Tax=Parasediminibacterium sp. JCM 36343 TaxID=3374279 RepID=UPI0039798BF8